MSGRRWGRILQFVLGALVVALAVRSAVRGWDAAAAQPIEWRLRPGPILLAALLVLAAYVVLIEAWRRVVLAMGQRLAPLEAARIWTVSSLGKYLPGKVWAVAGAAVMARDAGVSSTVAVTAAVLLQGLAVASGAAVVAGLTATRAVDASGTALGTAVAAVVAVGAVAGVLLLAWKPGVDLLNRLLAGRVPALTPVPAGVLVLGFGANVAAWLAYGTAFRLLAVGTLGGVDLPLPVAVASFAGSYLVGLLTLFAPGGVGPREGTMVLLLTPVAGARNAVALAIASRLLLTVTELGAAAPFLLRRAPVRAPGSTPDSGPS